MTTSRLEQSSIPTSDRPWVHRAAEQNGIRRGPRIEDPDAALVEGLKLRLPEAYDVLCSAYKKRLMGVAFKITKCAEDSEDVVQSTFLQVFRNVERFRGDCQFRSWISGIAINQALMTLRRKKRTIDSLDAGIEMGDHQILHAIIGRDCTPEQTCIRREMEDNLSRFAAQLKKTYRPVFEMHFAEELPLIEIARRLGITPAATKARLFRARKDMKSRANKLSQPTPFKRIPRTRFSENVGHHIRPESSDRVGSEMRMGWQSIAS